MENKPLITVIMSTYREEEVFLRKAIESILNQTYDNFEFLIAADDPTNHSLIKIIQEYEARDDRVRILVNEHNLGLANTLNRLIQEAKGTYIARMDADDVSNRERFEKQVCFMQDNNIDLLSCDVAVIDENDHIIQKMINLPSADKKIKRKLKINNCLPHPGWMVKAEVYRALGGYNNTPYCEDYEFLLRAREKGVVFGNVNQELLNYRMTSVSISRSNLYRQYLAMKYCQEKYIKKNDIQWDSYMEAHFDEKEQERYNKSANLFTDGLSLVKKARIFSGLIRLLQAFCGSSCYRDKMWKYLQQVL